MDPVSAAVEQFRDDFRAFLAGEARILRIEAKLEDVLDEVRQRDKQDSEREVAPLRQADDAVLVDSSGIDVEQVLDRMEAVVDERRAGA